MKPDTRSSPGRLSRPGRVGCCGRYGRFGRPHQPRRAANNLRQRGFTLIDVLVIIVLVGTVAGALTVVFSRLAASSAESMRARQVLALAQSLLTEVRMMPFSFCDPQDARAKLATSATASMRFVPVSPGPERRRAFSPMPK